MTSAGKTKDEKFVMRAYQRAMEAGDPETTLDRYAIGQELGIHPKGVDTICNLLAQANFIKKEGKVDFHLTENGVQLALKLGQ